MATRAEIIAEARTWLKRRGGIKGGSKASPAIASGISSACRARWASSRRFADNDSQNFS